MYTYNFYSKIRWLSKTLCSKESLVVWKITIIDPYVTLYSLNDYSDLEVPVNTRYDIVMPFDSDRHRTAHGYNAFLDKLSDSAVSHTHSHFVLPCDKDLVEELNDLLTTIGRNNETYIRTDLVEDCLSEYKKYLSKTSVDINKDIVLSLMSELFIKHESRGDVSRKLYENKIPNFETVNFAITTFLNKPGQDSLEAVRAVIQELLDLAPYSSEKGQYIRDELDKLLQPSSRVSFDRKFNENTYVFYAVIVLYATIIYGLTHSDFVTDNLGGLCDELFVFLIWKGLQRVEPTYTALVSWQNNIKDFSIASLRNNRALLFTNSDSELGNESDTNEETISLQSTS